LCFFRLAHNAIPFDQCVKGARGWEAAGMPHFPDGVYRFAHSTKALKKMESGLNPASSTSASSDGIDSNILWCSQ
jgi:hypothetical protein